MVQVRCGVAVDRKDAGQDVTGMGGAPGTFTCVPGSDCVVPGKPCLVGSTACSATGEASCMETTKPQANGSPCGGDSVCLDGVCTTCPAGTECPIEGKQCRVGIIECASGKPECTEVGNAANGASCSQTGQAPSQGTVCKDGSCVACNAGDQCVPANPCHQGTLACAGGVATCTDVGTSLPAGSACGTSKVCTASGECAACTAGMACDLPNEPCKLGKIECSSGAPVCTVAGDGPNGTACGNGKVCSQGTCVACNAGSSCTPTNKCRTGTLSCDSGMPVCQDTGMNAANGTGCGTNLYCSNGSCVPCTPNASCSTGNPCKTGTTSCATGSSQCRESGNAPDGRGCGNGMVCKDGDCVACEANTACQPSACKVGTTTCASGTSRCTETGNAPNGRACGNGGMLCNNGSCVSCASLGRRQCGTTCVEGNCCNDGDCTGGFACLNNRCSTSQCRSGLRPCGTTCVDGNCCNNGDCGTCKVCTNNRCANAPNGQGAGCDGDATCSNGTARTADSCQTGTCQRGTTRSCSPFACNGATCGSMCTGNTILVNGACVPCGGNEQPCCNGNTCPGGGGLVCMGGRCIQQLANGNNCSVRAASAPPATAWTASAATTAAPATCQECSTGTCRAVNGGSCGTNQECRSGTCTPCGTSGNVCCSGNTCPGGGGLVCSGTQPHCCPNGQNWNGSTCVPNCVNNEPCSTNPNNICFNGRRNCGAGGRCDDNTGSSKCQPGQVCRTNRCENDCGQPGQRCCPDFTCNAGHVCAEPGGAPADQVFEPNPANLRCVRCGGGTGDDFCCGARSSAPGQFSAVRLPRRDRCTGSGLVCPETESADLCTPCGGENEPCCLRGTACLKHACMNTICQCGFPGTPCCEMGDACFNGQCNDVTQRCP